MTPSGAQMRVMRALKEALFTGQKQDQGQRTGVSAPHKRGQGQRAGGAAPHKRGQGQRTGVIGATTKWWRGSCELHARSLAPLVKARGFGMTPSGARMQVMRALKEALFPGQKQDQGAADRGVRSAQAGSRAAGRGVRSGGAESGGLRDDGCRRQFLFREAFPLFASNFLAFDFSFRSNQKIRRHWRNFGG